MHLMSVKVKEFIDSNRVILRSLIRKAREEHGSELESRVIITLADWFRRTVITMTDGDITKTLVLAPEMFRHMSPGEFKEWAASTNNVSILKLIHALDKVPLQSREGIRIFPNAVTCIVMKL